MTINLFKSSLKLAFLTLCYLSSFGYAQSYTYTIVEDWDEEKKQCMACTYNDVTGELYETRTLELPYRGKASFNYTYEILESESIAWPSYYNKEYLPREIEFQGDFARGRNQNFLVARFNPIVLNGSSVSILKKIKVTVDVVENLTTSFDRTATFASTSVLSSGTWFKFGVDKSGVYRLDYDFLNGLGVDMSGLNPLHLNIYGNHIAQHTVTNSDYHPDDLIKNSIYIEGEGDGSFGTSDYVLFYATGPEVLADAGPTFQLSKNDNDSLAYYFIHIDAGDPAKRISSIGDSPTPSTHNLNNTSAVYLHELDQVNLLKSGDGWFGELFDLELTKTIPITLEEVDTSIPINSRVAFVSAKQSGTARMYVRVNGVNVDTIDVSGSMGSYTVALSEDGTAVFNVSGSNLSYELEFQRSSPASQAWLDYILINYRRRLRVSTNQFLIHDLSSVGIGNVAEYTISNYNSSVQVWEVTDGTNVSRVNGTVSGTNFIFKQNADSLRRFVVSTPSQAFEPTPVGFVPNQNLHGLGQFDYIIISHATLLTQAERLANLHRANGLSVQVVDVAEVYNEFTSGMADPIAIRWFMKMFWDRAAGNVNLQPKSLCLFGDGTYDPLNRIENNNYLIPTYRSPEAGSIEFISSFTSDDFFTLLDDSEAMGAADLMDIGVGRIPVTTPVEADQVVDKIEHYMNFGSTLFANATGVQCDDNGYSSSFGDWRNRLVLLADDKDKSFDNFVDDCENLSDSTEKLYPEMNIVKIYLDAYQQTVTSGGQRYPDVEEAIDQNINRGALVFNYVGHGGETGLTLERVLTTASIQEWTNVNNLTIFISATCEFSRFDDPERTSAGEITLTSPFGGAVGLLTTTRLVSVITNTQLVKNLYTVLFLEENGVPLSIGEITRRTKNLTAGDNNMRNFSVIGDPALVLGKPSPRVITDSLNGVAITTGGLDTLKALSKITISGHLEDYSGTTLTSYNGLVFPTVYDKWKTRVTLGQDAGSPQPFDLQNNIIYKGKSSVNNGYFQFSFIVPKDIDYNYGKGKLSHYAHDDNSNQYGWDTSFVVGGVDPNGIVDNDGPEIELFMNDESFVNGGLTNDRPIFLAHVRDENGINTTGNGIGHNITLVIDGNSAEAIILNNFYEADLDTYQSGKVSYPLSDLDPGLHTVTFKVWDVNNNSSESTLEFNVVEEEEVTISNLLNYPNPFTTSTEFFFEHNQVCSNLLVQLEIFTVSGKLVKTIQQIVNNEGFRSEGIHWDGLDEYGDKLARGVYVYRLTIETPQGLKAEKTEKLVIL
ncbi:MAG: type IX secretion system sortase PorU [Crocinitomicaceae bacterium]|nr:type IX secretion system sortase PorU [Crocinitomicaceae bacterium]